MAGHGFWKSFHMFAPLPPEVLEALAAVAQQRRWAAGEGIFQRGDPGVVAADQADCEPVSGKPQFGQGRPCRAFGQH